MQGKAQLNHQVAVGRALSDAELSAHLAHRDLAALDAIYDRYMTLVYTLLCNANPLLADTRLATVFYLLWERADQTQDKSLLNRLLALTEETVTSQGEVSQVLARGYAFVPALVPFSQLPEDMFGVSLLVYLGRLGVAEVSAALGCDRSSVLRALAAPVPGALTNLGQRERGASC